MQNEKAWKSGSTTRSVSLPSTVMSSNARSAPSMSAMKFPCVSIAPFGLPVVPDV